MQVTVFSYDNRGRAVKTQWGPVPFDDKGYAVIDVPEADLSKLRALRWLVESTVGVTSAPAAPAEHHMTDAEAIAEAKAVEALELPDDVDTAVETPKKQQQHHRKHR